jgi:hypothetical protein
MALPPLHTVLAYLDATKTDTTSHAGAVPLLVVAIVLFVAAVVVRKVIKLAIVVVLAGIVVLVIAGWRAGTFG